MSRHMLTVIVDNLTRLSFLIDADEELDDAPSRSGPAPASGPTGIAVGHRLGAYVVEAPLARGGMAMVWQVRHTRLGSRHALKVPLVRDPAINRRALREARIQANLRHPNIVPVTDLVDVGGSPGLVLELIEGGEGLDTRLAQGRMGEGEIRTIFHQILDAMEYAHASGVVHRDLKPGNVLLARVDGRVVARVTDFGLARSLAADPLRLTQLGQVMGTPLYMAPEQARDSGTADARADVFALGALLYELTTGTPAFDAPEVDQILARAANGAYNPPEVVAPTIPVNWARAIRAALNPDPDSRVADIASLRALFDGNPPPSRTRKEATPLPLGTLLTAHPEASVDLCPAASPPATRRRHRLPLRTVVAAMVLVGGLLGGLVMLF